MQRLSNVKKNCAVCVVGDARGFMKGRAHDSKNVCRVLTELIPKLDAPDSRGDGYSSPELVLKLRRNVMLGVGEKEVEVVNTLPTVWEKCFSGAAVVQSRDTPPQKTSRRAGIDKGTYLVLQSGKYSTENNPKSV